MSKLLTSLSALSWHRKLWAAIFVLLFVTTFWPLFIPLHHTKAVSFYGMLHYTPWSVITLGTLAAGIWAAVVARRRFWLLSNIFLLVSVLLLFATNGSGDTDLHAPEPYNSIAALLYVVVVPLMLLGALLQRIYRYSSRRKPAVTAKPANIKQARQTVKQTRQAAAAARQERFKVQALQSLQSPQQISYVNGAFLAIGGPIAGILIWLGLWEVGFMASIATYIMVRLTILLYQKGSGSPAIDKRALWIILGYVTTGLLLCFFASFTSDVVKEILKEAPADQHLSVFGLLNRPSFWKFDLTLLTDGSVLKNYAGNFAFALLLGGLGLYGTIRQVLLPNHRATEHAKTELAQKPLKKQSSSSDWPVIE